jgi:hypothetical protein
MLSFLGIVCTDPPLLAKLMGLFICPDIHELSLLSFVEKLRRPRNAVLTYVQAKSKILLFLQMHQHQIKSPLSMDELSDLLLFILNELGFILKLTLNESLQHNSLGSSYLIPSLRTFGEFQWNYELSARSTMNTFGRRISKKDGKPFLSMWFCKFEVRVRTCLLTGQVKLFTMFRGLSNLTPHLYSNGMLVKFYSDAELLVLLSPTKLHLDILIIGEIPFMIWEIVNKLLKSLLVDFTVEILHPDDIFMQAGHFPLKLDSVNSISSNTLGKLTAQESSKAMYGSNGQVLRPPNYRWTFYEKLQFKAHSTYPQLQILELEPPPSGKDWENDLHKTQYNIVKSAFDFFIGVDGKNVFKMDKVVLLKNDVLEQKFTQTYHKFSRQSQSPKLTDHVEWRSSITSTVRSFLF